MAMNPLTVLQVMIDSGLLVLIWLVQLIIYPSFQYTEGSEFVRWHHKYTGLISLIVSPLMLAQAAIEVVRLQKEADWLRILLIGLIWLSTFTLSVPCHNRLHKQGKEPATLHRLITTNWIRTVLWSLLFLGTVHTVFAQMYSG